MSTISANHDDVPTTRTGKIARLPFDIRTELNQRLREGELGQELVDWLNGLPEVQAVLAAQFRGRPITEQNLSEWRQGGYLDWQLHEETRAWAESLGETMRDSSGKTLDPEALARRATALTFAIIGQRLEEYAHHPRTPENERLLVRMMQQLERLLRAEAAASKAAVERRQIEAEEEKKREEAMEMKLHKAKTRRMMQMIDPKERLDDAGFPILPIPPMNKEERNTLIEYTLDIRNIWEPEPEDENDVEAWEQVPVEWLPAGAQDETMIYVCKMLEIYRRHEEKLAAEKAQAAQSESDPIQPNPTESNLP